MPPAANTLCWHRHDTLPSNATNMKTFLTTALLLTTLIPAQGAAALKQELKTKEAAAKRDPDALFEAGKWASENGLSNDARRIYQAVLKIKADHEGANLAVGNALFEGKWLTAKEAEALRKRADAAAYAAKGFVEVQGVWVEKSQVEDAKKGIFHHERELVTKDEKVALMRGFVRHPDTQELIDPRFLEKAQNHLFPIGNDGRWVDEKEADKYHSDAQRPWIVRSAFSTLVSSLPLAQLTPLRLEADKAVERAQRALVDALPRPAHRPVILIADTTQRYQEFGRIFSDGTDAAGAFLARDREDAQFRVPYLGQVRPAVTLNEGQHTPYYLRHATAMAWLQGIAADIGADLPAWFLQGAGSLGRYFVNDSDAGWYGKQQMQRGGVKNLKGFFAGFAINGDMEPSQVSANVYLAGLMLAYASSKDADPTVAAAFKAVKDCLSDAAAGSKAPAAIEKLAGTLVAAEPKIAAYLQELLKLAPQ
jgi:hypothetical protein